MTDQELIDLTLNVDKNNFSSIVEKYQKQIYVYLLRLLNFHNQDAEDVLSETFVKIFINLGNYNPSLKFSSWLYRIAHNEAVNLIKKKSKMYYSADLEKIDVPANLDFDKPNKIDLEKILNQLSLDDKNILILFYLDEKSIKEMSEILKISENNVAVKLNRARNKAKKFVKN